MHLYLFRMVLAWQTRHSQEFKTGEKPDMALGMKFFRGIAAVKPDWYFEDRHSTDIPALMRKVQKTLDSKGMKEEVSFERYASNCLLQKDLS